MVRKLPILLAAFLPCVSLVSQASAEDVFMHAAPGAKMVPNEYGDAFPSEIVWEKDGAVMVLIPYGSFTRGLSPEHGGGAGESPEKVITVPSFYIDKFEVSNKKYDIFVSDTSKAQARPTNENLRGDDKPVSAIDWEAASDYAKWVGKSVPTEAMWEKAARGAEGRIYSTGDTAPAKDVVIWGRGSIGATVPVTQNTGDVNSYGLYHMGGNVSEWVSDWYLREGYDSEATDNPTGPAEGETKVYRGGSFFTQKAEDTRTTRRMSQGKRQILDELGFRCVWVPADPRNRTPVPSPVAATPTLPPPPTKKDLTDAFCTRLAVFLQDHAQRLPQELMASKAYADHRDDELQIVNFSPYELSLTFYGPDEDLCFKYNEPVAPMTFKNLLLPRERNLAVIAYAPDADRKGPTLIGSVRAESKIIMVLNTELFSSLSDGKGTAIPLLEKTEAPQFYEDNFNPQWYEFEVRNTMTSKMVFKIFDVTKGKTAEVSIGEYTMDPNQIIRLQLSGGTYRVKADYIAAVEESSTPQDFKIDDKVARHLILIKEDTARQGPGVTVVTEKRPYVALQNLEAKRAAFSSKESTKDQKPRK